MAITYPLNLPTATGINNITLRQVNATVTTQSPFSFAQQTLVHPGKRWEADVVLPPMNNTDARIWLSWMTSLKGSEGTFLMGDPLHTSPTGSAGGTPLVNGASQTGDELIIDGATAGQTGWLKAGDYIQLGSGSSTELYIVLADANSDGSGNVTLDIWPDLRTSPANNAAVTTSNCKGLFRMSSNTSEFRINDANFYGIQFSAIEAL